MRKHFVSFAALALIVIFGTYGLAAGAEFPTKPITIICSYAPGGSVDGISRAVAAAAEKYLGQPVVVVNKPGALGLIGEVEGVRAKPDGYTMTARATGTISTMVWEEINGRNPGYRLDEFVHIGAVTLDPTLIVVPYTSPWNSMDDLIKACKAKPDF
ncbi:MAG: tripartite tricarboxylate transporter substrate-binding protein, partial [bacterium]